MARLVRVFKDPELANAIRDNADFIADGVALLIGTRYMWLVDWDDCIYVLRRDPDVCLDSECIKKLLQEARCCCRGGQQ